MKSRLQGRLESEIANAPNSLTADCLRCELAAYLARLGDFDEAARELGTVQQRCVQRPHPATSAWASIADSLVSLYSDVGPLASDKMKRAHAMSTAVGLRPAQALSAAWLSHLAYRRGDATGTARFAAEALRLALEDHHAARARASLTIAQAYHAAGRYDLGRPWYEGAQRHATTEGDDTTLSAILWSMASLRVANMRAAQACESGGAWVESPAGAACRDHVLLSCESTATFDKLKGVRSLPALQPILRAQLCLLVGKVDEALPLYETYLDAALGQGMRSAEAALLADRAWCRLQAGRMSGALDDAASAKSWLEADVNAGSSGGHRAPAHSRLARLFEALDDPDGARHQERAAAMASKEHQKEQAGMVNALDREFTAVADC